MAEFEDKLQSILSNPELMGQIMSMAQSLSNSPPPQPELSAQPGFDPAMLQQLSAVMGQSNIDGNQQTLLRALNPYLSGRKVEKLERAMRAAKMARMASGFLGQGGLSSLLGR